jgi:hypothetical protein
VSCLTPYNFPLFPWFSASEASSSSTALSLVFDHWLFLVSWPLIGF